jgi:hypothetical protein
MALNSTRTTTDAAPRQTKQQIMIDLLRRPEGAGIEEITAATGWQSHTVRGAMSRGSDGSIVSSADFDPAHR